MNRKSFALVAVAIVVTGIAGTIVNRMLITTSAQTEQPSAGQKWEYWALRKAAFVGSNRGGLFWISYFRDSGVQVVEIEDPALEKDGPAKAVAKLGAEGWELVGEGPLEIRQGTLRALYFKRPK
jgi:hypothetical protein